MSFYLTPPNRFVFCELVKPPLGSKENSNTYNIPWQWVPQIYLQLWEELSLFVCYETWSYWAHIHWLYSQIAHIGFIWPPPPPHPRSWIGTHPPCNSQFKAHNHFIYEITLFFLSNTLSSSTMKFICYLFSCHAFPEALFKIGPLLCYSK